MALQMGNWGYNPTSLRIQTPQRAFVGLMVSILSTGHRIGFGGDPGSVGHIKRILFWPFGRGCHATTRSFRDEKYNHHGCQPRIHQVLRWWSSKWSWEGAQHPPPTTKPKPHKVGAGAEPIVISRELCHNPYPDAPFTYTFAIKPTKCS